MRDSVAKAMEVCPVEVAIAVLGGSWKMTIVKHLVSATLRFGELSRVVGGVSARMLTRQLRELEADGVVHREVYAEVPPRVEYSLTELGRTLVPLVQMLDEWGANYQERAAQSPSRSRIR
ncbi:winged helix-turn-helix transcriptional regulator [Hoyosella altamirensis]|uniref:DNA-binding HxlR family transcriptional regulator n=1 Tax=Hoyosella altamirensis TaxID=616997 RepID=A0A839RHM5_9ACTN|nr:helix-turn-helix domain-containing protein [Hoyosella altamirensis]MBB3035738.1 DNA-binding HxlR family transcriptional regulator [Hoyosella altamirensis]